MFSHQWNININAVQNDWIIDAQLMGCVQTFPQSPSCVGVWVPDRTTDGEIKEKENPPCTVGFCLPKETFLSSPLLSRSTRFLSEADGNWLSTLPWKKLLGQQFTQQLLQRRERDGREKEDIGENEANGAYPPPPTHTQTYKHIYRYLLCTLATAACSCSANIAI